VCSRNSLLTARPPLLSEFVGRSVTVWPNRIALAVLGPEHGDRRNLHEPDDPRGNPRGDFHPYVRLTIRDRAENQIPTAPWERGASTPPPSPGDGPATPARSARARPRRLVGTRGGPPPRSVRRPPATVECRTSAGSQAAVPPRAACARPVRRGCRTQFVIPWGAGDKDLALPSRRPALRRWGPTSGHADGQRSQQGRQKAQPRLISPGRRGFGYEPHRPLSRERHHGTFPCESHEDRRTRVAAVRIEHWHYQGHDRSRRPGDRKNARRLARIVCPLAGAFGHVPDE